MPLPRQPGLAEAGQDNTHQCGDVQDRRQPREVDAVHMEPASLTSRRCIAAAMGPRGQLPGQRLAPTAVHRAHGCAQIYTSRCRYRDSRGDDGTRRTYRHDGRELLPEPTACASHRRRGRGSNRDADRDRGRISRRVGRSTSSCGLHRGRPLPRSHSRWSGRGVDTVVPERARAPSTAGSRLLNPKTWRLATRRSLDGSASRPHHRQGCARVGHL